MLISRRTHDAGGSLPNGVPAFPPGEHNDLRMNATQQDDAALVREYARTGSATAFALVVARHADFVFATALRQTRRFDLAEDVTQAAFIVLARRARALRQNASVASFLHQTVLFAAKNALRAEARRRKHERHAATHASALASSVPTLDDKAIAMDRALLRLRDSDRALLMLRYVHGDTIDQAADKLGIAREAARKRLHRALLRLKRQLQGDGVTLGVTAIAPVLKGMAQPLAPTNPAAIASTAVAGGTDGSAFTLASQVVQALKVLALQKALALLGAVVLIIGTAAVAFDHLLPRPPAPRRVTAAPVANATSTARRDEIIDYEKVFDRSRRAIEHRRGDELIRQTLKAQVDEHAAKIADLQRRRDAAAPGSPEAAQLAAEYQSAVAAKDLFGRTWQTELANRQRVAMLQLFQAIERAVATVAAEEHVQLPATTPYPANLDKFTVDQLRTMINARRLPKPAGAPDLTDKVLALVNSEYAAQKLQASTAPAQHPVVVGEKSKLVR
jgi:RNA polymerase sigma factor (sigma-70 family)